MNPYLNLGGSSGVVAYRMDVKSIEVEFHDGAAYSYTSVITGLTHVDRMKELAVGGQGLNTYINRHVRKRYARRLR